MQESESKLLQTSTLHVDERGTLLAWENENLPFAPLRTFLISGVPKNQKRANHSVSCDLVLTAILGSVDVELDHRKVISLNKNTESLWVTKNTFIVLKNFSNDASVLVFAEKPYNSTMYFG